MLSRAWKDWHELNDQIAQINARSNLTDDDYRELERLANLRAAAELTIRVLSPAKSVV